jgi:hypothetical protein
MDLMTQHTKSYKQQKHNMSEYKQLEKKKAEKPDYLQDPPYEPDLCLGFPS